ARQFARRSRLRRTQAPTKREMGHRRARGPMTRLLLMMALVLSGVAQAERPIVIVATSPGQPSLHGYVPAVRRALGDVLAGVTLVFVIDARLGPPPARLSASALALLQARVKQSERNLFFNGTHVRESNAELEDV